MAEALWEADRTGREVCGSREKFREPGCLEVTGKARSLGLAEWCRGTGSCSLRLKPLHPHEGM